MKIATTIDEVRKQVKEWKKEDWMENNTNID